MKNHKNFAIIIFFNLILLVSSLSGLTIQPSVVELSLSAGQSTNGFYIVQNDTACKAVIQTGPESYYGLAATNWFKSMITCFTLNAGERKNVEYRVILPKNFKDEVIGKIYFTSIPVREDDDTSGGTSIITRMGSSFYVSARENALLLAEASHFTIQNNKISVDIKNNGNVHLRFYYDLQIFDDKGREITTTDRVPFAVVIPGESKTVSNPLKTDQKLLAGGYYGVLNLYYGNVMPLVDKLSILSKFEVLK